MLEFTKFPAKRKNLGYLRKGDVILYNDKLYLYDRIPNGSSSVYVTDMETRKSLKLRITSDKQFFDIVGYCENSNTQSKNDINELQQGDLFVIDHEQKGSYIFRFEKANRSNIIAINPMNNKEVRISMNFICTKIGNMPF